MIEVVNKIADQAAKRGGRAFVVGGHVRDELLGIDSHDIDLEIFGLDIEQIEALLQQFGQVHHGGKQFAILLLETPEGTIEVAAPRREIKTGSGHRGFSVEVDPTLTPAAAARRRDFTINAMMRDPLTGELVDPYHGAQDLQNKILRVVDEVTFQEDPLRVLRGIQIAARLDLAVEPKTLGLLRQMVSLVKELSGFRRMPEWQKLFGLAARPSAGLELAHRIGLFEQILPEAKALEQTPQDPTAHPEGSVWKHTLLAVDAASVLARKYHAEPDQQLRVILGAFLHDVGKATTTTQEDGRWIAYGHAEAGATIAEKFLLQEGFSDLMSRQVAALVREHMHLFQLEKLHEQNQLTPGAIRRLINRLAPASPLELLTVREADAAGTFPTHQHTFTAREWLPPQLEQLGLTLGPAPVIQGRDLLQLGWTADIQIGRVIEAAEHYVENTNTTREDVLALIRTAGSPERAIAQLATAHPEHSAE